MTKICYRKKTPKGKKRLVILQLSRKCSGNPQNTASLRLKSRLAKKVIFFCFSFEFQFYALQNFENYEIVAVSQCNYWV